jgi:hypothetical protein
MTSERNLGQETLTVPDRPYAGVVTNDAKDPERRFRCRGSC